MPPYLTFRFAFVKLFILFLRSEPEYIARPQLSASVCKSGIWLMVALVFEAKLFKCPNSMT